MFTTLFQELGIEIFVVAVGEEISQDFSNLLASEPTNEHIMVIENYTKIANALHKLEKNLCGKTFRSFDYLGKTLRPQNLL